MASNSNDKETMTTPFKVETQDQACQFDSALVEGMKISPVSWRSVFSQTKAVFSYLLLKIDLDAPVMCDACTSVPR